MFLIPADFRLVVAPPVIGIEKGFESRTGAIDDTPPPNEVRLTPRDFPTERSNSSYFFNRFFFCFGRASAGGPSCLLPGIC